MTIGIASVLSIQWAFFSLKGHITCDSQDLTLHSVLSDGVAIVRQTLR